jgi:hypothetical protein
MSPHHGCDGALVPELVLALSSSNVPGAHGAVGAARGDAQVVHVVLGLQVRRAGGDEYAVHAGLVTGEYRHGGVLLYVPHDDLGILGTHH